MSVLLEFSMFPTDKGESVSEYVSQVIAMIRDSGLPYQLTPMGTIIETDTLPEALALVEQASRILDEAGCNRIYSSLKLDIRKGRQGRLRGKMDSIREKIGEVAG
ncbi:MAG: MTH1187 family thiamine-binding protein [Gammaproteobacteria bacterium]|nr:MTH1187 family thiamine-binding protein [Gammaproteobacteria bacterium]